MKGDFGHEFSIRRIHKITDEEYIEALRIYNETIPFEIRTETNEIEPGETEEISLDVKWVNNENNLGERIATAEIIETSNEARAGEITTKDNESKADMIISIVTGEYDNIIILSVIATIGLLAIIGEIILIKKYVL